VRKSFLRAACGKIASDRGSRPSPLAPRPTPLTALWAAGDRRAAGARCTRVAAKTAAKMVVVSALAIATLLGMPRIHPAQAEESAGAGTKPVLAVSISGFDAVKKDLGTIGTACGVPQLPDMLLSQLPPPVSGLLEHIDKAKPWGVVVQTDGQQFPVYGFVPVTDLAQLLRAVSELPDAPPIPEPDADGIYEFPGPEGQAGFLQQKGSWAILSNSREGLAAAPADPSPLLGGMPKSYAVALRVTVKNIPRQLRDQALMPLQMGMAMGLQQMPGESDEEYAVRKQMTERSLKEFSKLINETDTVQIGLAVEPQSKAVRLDVELTALPGTDTAADLTLLSESKSNLVGFFRPDAALTMLLAQRMAESDIAELEGMIDTYGPKALNELEKEDLSDEEKALAKQVLTDLIDVARKTAEGGRVDVGLALIADSDSLNLVAGGGLAETDKLEKLVKQLVGSFKGEIPQLAEILTLDAEQHQGVRFHTLSIPADKLSDFDLEELPPSIVGEALVVVLGFGPDNIYLAVGPKAIQTLKQAIDQSKAAPGQSVAPFRISLSAKAIGRLVEGWASQEELGPGALFLGMLKQIGEDDHITVAVHPIPNGMRVRWELEEGILQLIGFGLQGAMAQMGPGAPAP
jgi:hypothetical protein